MSRPPAANQAFLGSWMVDIHQEGRSQRPAPQNRHTAHLRRCALCTPRKPSGWDGGGGKPQPSTGGESARQAPGRLSCSDLGRAQNAGPTKSAPLWRTREPEPERLIPGECITPGPASDRSQQSNLESEQGRLGEHTRCERGQTSVAESLGAHARDVCSQCSSLPTARLNKGA